MTANMEGKVTEEAILTQCISMSNDNIHAFFNYSPHLEEGNRLHITVKYNNEQIYSNYETGNYNKSPAELLQDLIAIQYEAEARQEGMQNEI